MYRRTLPIQDNRIYDTDLSDAQWALLAPLLPQPVGSGRRQQISFRYIINAILYLLRTGCQWRLLPKDYPKWQTVYYHFAKWRRDQTWDDIVTALRELHRTRTGRKATPSMVIIDSQSVKTTEAGGERGFDGGKLVKGRKRHIVVDTLGNLLAVLVLPANIPDREAAEYVLRRLITECPRLERILADGSYTGEELATWVDEFLGCVLDVVTVPKDQKGFVVKAFRWTVERTFSWLGRHRRLAKDFEYLAQTVETLCYMAMSHILVKRLAA